MSKKVKMADLIPDAKNHNNHTQSGMALLEKSVEQVGVIESITISSDNQIISGNARHEVIGRKLETEPIIIETDGTRPVILKRTDIKSNTSQFYKASILANTTAKKNIDIDIDVVNEISAEYNLEPEELGVEMVTGGSYKNRELNEDDFTADMTITLQFPEDTYWQVKKALSEIAKTPEAAVCKLLKLED